MYYSISGICPRLDLDMGRQGFFIHLHPLFKEQVAKSKITEKNALEAVKDCGRSWLDNCGYSQMYDPDNAGFDADKKKKPGPRARPLYEPNQALRVSWGEWGPEHISVPGNACGLDIDRQAWGNFYGGVSLVPHNVDSVSQKLLLLTVFTYFADAIDAVVISDEIQQRPKTKRSAP